jgi:hypothetical protein
MKLSGIVLVLVLALTGCNNAETPKQQIQDNNVTNVSDVNKTNQGEAVGKEYGGKGTGYGQVKKSEPGNAVTPIAPVEDTRLTAEALARKINEHFYNINPSSFQYGIVNNMSQLEQGTTNTIIIKGSYNDLGNTTTIVYDANEFIKQQIAMFGFKEEIVVKTYNAYEGKDVMFSTDPEFKLVLPEWNFTNATKDLNEYLKANFSSSYIGNASGYGSWNFLAVQVSSTTAQLTPEQVEKIKAKLITYDMGTIQEVVQRLEGSWYVTEFKYVDER